MWSICGFQYIAVCSSWSTTRTKMTKFTFLLIFSVVLSRYRAQSASVCTIFEFRCPNGKCIPSDWRCNDRKDCPDGSDEVSCSNELPGKIAKLKVIPNDETSVIVSWIPKVNTNSPPVASFRLRYKEISSHVYASVEIQKFLRSFVVKNLRPLGLYEFTISATNKVGTGPQSDVVLARVKPQEAEEPSLQGVPLNSSAILLSWNHTSDSPTLGYFIYYKNVMEDESESGLTFTVSTIKRRVLLTNGIKEGRTYRIRVQPFTIHGYGPIIGPVLVKTPTANVNPPDFMVSIDKDSLHYEALLTVERPEQGKAYALRFGKSVTKSLPVIDEKVTLLSPNFSGGYIRIEPFLWHYFGLSVQGGDGRWSQENFKWLRGPLHGYSGISSAPDSVSLFWSQINRETNPDEYLVSFKASDEFTKSKILVRNENKLGYSRVQIGSLRGDTMYHFEVSNGDAKCDSLKKIRFSVKTMSKKPMA